MSENVSRALRGGARAVTGLLIVGVAATAAVLLGAAPLPSIARDPVAVPVDALQGGERSLACAGSFAELGANPRNPSAAVPRGEAIVVTAGAKAERSALERERSGGSAPAAFRVPADRPFAAAQLQTLDSDSLRGLTAQSCAEPANEQWLVGGATVVGNSATVNLGNPSAKPATVQLTVFDEDGQVDSAQTSGVLVPAGSERIVSLNGYAPGRDRIAVRVVSTGAGVTASLGLSQVTGLEPFSADTVTRQLAADTSLVIPGIVNLDDAERGPNDAADVDQFRVVVRALAVDGGPGTATVRALLPDGGSKRLGSIELSGNAVGELVVGRWPAAATAVVIEADAPIVGGALGSVSAGGAHDNAWFVPAPQLPAKTETPVAAVGGAAARLVIANPGEQEARVRVRVGDAAQSYRVPARGTVWVAAAPASVLVSDVPVYAGVRLIAGGGLAGYPVLTQDEHVSELTVYPR